MKKLAYIVITVFILSCNSSSAPDCFQNSGEIIQKEFPVETFTKVTVFERIELIIKEGPAHSVLVETGEFLLDEIEVEVKDGRLLLNNNNGCNLTRDFGITKIYITAPNLTEIRSSTGLPTRSDGVLTYPNITIFSENFSDDFHADGLIKLQIENTSVVLVINNLATTYFEGSTDNLNIQFAAGDARFEGRNFEAQNINIFHRGSNDITVNPQLSLRARVVSTGDVIVVNTPPTVSLQTPYKGRVIFE